MPVKSCTLIISTYNWPDALRLCLKSVVRQIVLPDEVIIADDGSTETTADLIRDFQKQFPVPIKHAWHPDEGFRLASIRNKGICLSEGEYIIQVDGDLILHPKFISNHLEFSKVSYFTTGSRVMLAPDLTRELLRNQSIKLPFQWINPNMLNGLHCPPIRNFLGSRYKVQGKNKYYVKGCNMAFWKSDLEKVNGYDESFAGWGKEDSDIAIRLMNAGVKKQFIKMGAVCYHLFHKEATRASEERNTNLMTQSIEQKKIWAESGLNLHR